MKLVLREATRHNTKKETLKSSELLMEQLLSHPENTRG